MSEIIDLDVLVPKACTIRFEGQEIVVQPPKAIDILTFGYYTEKLINADYSTPQGEEALGAVTKQLYKAIPELDGKELSKAQITKLIGLMRDMAVPQETKDLEAQGITLEPSKKAPED